MKILLDECIDRRLAREFSEHEVRTVPQMGWAAIKNGYLLRRAEGAFDVFETVDRNLSYQQDLPRHDIAVIVLRSTSNRYQDLKPFAPLIEDWLPKLRTGSPIVLSLR